MSTHAPAGLDQKQLKNLRQVAQALDAAWQRATSEPALPCPVDGARFVIFSDQHKGARNHADDFRRSERAYNAALAWYFERGYTLVELGDVEELWEERPGPVLKAYRHTLDITAAFHAAGRYHRVFGNHDDLWSFPGKVDSMLGPIFPALRVRESIRLNVQDADRHLGTIFMLHGHQGTTASDKLGAFARFPVRYVWRPIQRLFKVSLNTPATDWRQREGHNRALYEWAVRQHQVVLIAGHTHRPVFVAGTLEQELTARLEAARTGTTTDTALLAARLEWARSQGLHETGPEGTLPPLDACYFNSGCCSYSDGDITGLEIADGAIRLVRWPDDQGQPLPQLLDAPMPLRRLFATPPADAPPVRAHA
jgi:hypothetical protein